jgi:hypothetical protein
VEAWSSILSDWNQLQHTLYPDGSGRMLPGLGEALESADKPAPRPTPPRTAPTASTAAPSSRPGLLTPSTAAPAMPAAASPAPRANPLERYVRGLGAMPGVVSGCVFEIQTSRVLAHLGARGPAIELARRGTTLLAAAGHARKQLVLAGRPDEVVVNGGAHSMGLRVLMSQPEWAVHLVYTPAQADWPQLRPQLMALDAALPRSPVL